MVSRSARLCSEPRTRAILLYRLFTKCPGFVRDYRFPRVFSIVNEEAMVPALNRTRTILALSCCLIVLATTTAYLAHTAQQHHHNGKAIEDSACLLCAFSASTPPDVVQVLPCSAKHVEYRLAFADEHFVATASLRLKTGRAPPATS